ncbi:MAG: Hsp20/alpha crystallin family protein [Candidatus Omnitrophica bacterium]|nr:Hsp20/alpha crystallin family protein [Candidatus Omnitrophota bacterium]
MQLIPWQPHSPKIWDPFSEIEKLQKNLNTLFDSTFEKYLEKRSSKKEFAFWTPELDIHESKDNIVVKADLPGLDKKDIKLKLEGRVLTIEGEKKYSKSAKEKSCLRQERFYGSFIRTVTLPSEVDVKKAKATYKNGVLELNLPKQKSSYPSTKTIKIN